MVVTIDNSDILKFVRRIGIECFHATKDEVTLEY